MQWWQWVVGALEFGAAFVCTWRLPRYIKARRDRPKPVPPAPFQMARHSSVPIHVEKRIHELLRQEQPSKPPGSALLSALDWWRYEPPGIYLQSVQVGLNSMIAETERNIGELQQALAADFQLQQWDAKVMTALSSTPGAMIAAPDGGYGISEEPPAM
jgi:hypothetical protein